MRFLKSKLGIIFLILYLIVFPIVLLFQGEFYFVQLDLLAWPWYEIIENLLRDLVAAQYDESTFSVYLQKAEYNSRGMGLSREDLTDVAKYYMYLDSSFSKLASEDFIKFYLPILLNAVLLFFLGAGIEKVLRKSRADL